MDAKDLRIESALGAHSDDGNTKYAQSGTVFQTNGNKPYQDIGPNSLAKVDVPNARPCAIIGPDRVVPPHSTNDTFVKKVPLEPWPCSDNLYQHPPEYPHKPTEYQLSRNISPRQTFQENMQRIMVPPTYASVKNSEDQCLKTTKLPLESKFCDVPYTVSPLNSEPKIVKTSEGLVLNNNSNQPVLPHNWPSNGVNVRPLRPYGAPDFYPYSEYSNYPGPRPISMIRPHRNLHEEMPQVYQDRYHEANIRFKPYPTTKERQLQNPHSRYDYIPNYPNTFPPHASYPPHKYELQKSIPTHAYSVYPPVPLKYLERRMAVPTMEKYPRSPTQQVNFNQTFSNQNIPPGYGTLPGNCLQSRAYPYAPEPSTKNMIQNRIYFDSNNARKYYTSSENMFLNDINRSPTIKPDLMYPSYPPINIHTLPPHHMYRKETSMKGYEHSLHYRNIEYSANINPLSRLPLQFSPQNTSISPSDSNTSNDAMHIYGNAQEDCGYASQSSTASIRSIESGVQRLTNDVYRRQEMSLFHMNKFGQKLDTSTDSKDKKGLDVRQFLQMWNEGDDEGNDNNKETIKQRDSTNSLVCCDADKDQEQLYVLDLVNVPKEELGKYDHIQKISKLPENIKGYNSIELLNQYEKLVESPGLNHFSLTPPHPKQKDLHVPIRNNFPRNGIEMSSTSARPLSPLDVEAKISQSVIHKEVGCNFEIRPCSPQMMNVELATPVHNILGERLIEKVVNPVKTKSPLCQRIEETNNISSRCSPKVPSCKMANNQYPSPHINDSLKTNYSLQDLESNSGVCLASLPRLDNDIELHFPEINQQFINDNKKSTLRDLPILDTENVVNAYKIKSKVQNHPLISEHINSGSDSDKDVSKLSKYRKHKKNPVPNENEDSLSISLHRTNSVIIKNPENSKTQDLFINNAPLIDNTPSFDNIVNPINIIVQSDIDIKCYNNKKSETVIEKFDDYKSLDNDTAIDFSLNKSDDAQNNSTNNSLSNLSDSLQNNIEIDKNIYMNNEDKNCGKKISTQLEVSASDTFSILQPKSPMLDNVSNDNIVLQTIDEEKQVLQGHETVIIHSKSKETAPDVSLINVPSLTEEIATQDLPSISHNEHVLMHITECDNNMSEDVTVLNNEIDNQALNYCLAEHPNDIITPTCELQHNVVYENQKEHNIIIKDTDMKDGSESREIENISISQELGSRIDTEKHSDTETKNNIVDKDEKIENVPFESDINKDTTNIILKNGNEESIFDEDEKLEIVPIKSNINKDTIDMIVKTGNEESNFKQPSEEDSVIDFKSDNYVDFSTKCSDENHESYELPAVSILNCSKSQNSDIIPISMYDFDPSNMSCTEIENDVSFSKTNRNINDDVKSKLEISISSFNECLRTEIIKCNAESYRVISSSTFSFKKELFSSRIQNLFIQSEGSCTPITRSGNHHAEDFYTKDNCQKVLQDDSLVFAKPYFEETNVDPELEITEINKAIVKNDDEDISKSLDSLEEFVENGTTIAGNKHRNCEDNNTVSSPDKDEVQEMIERRNDITTNYVNSKIHSESFVEGICNAESILQVAEEPTIGAAHENDMEINDKINNHNQENNPIRVSWNPLPNKRHRTLKRSLSESAVTEYTAAYEMKESLNLMSGRKRAKISDSDIIVESEVFPENLSFIQTNRRNSVSTIYKDENVSFCIFIDNDCVLTEENDNCEKICYTEITDDCLNTICTEEDVSNSELTEDITYGGTVGSEDQEVDSELTGNVYYENDALICGIADDNITSELDSENISFDEPEQCLCDNNIIFQNMEDKTIEETWVEDVACMETVFSDDIAEDVVISARSSPKISESDDECGNTNFLYNIDGNEHTNKVKHIYGNQMCEDDAELVDKLYRTPQMNVNKTLIDRESQHLQDYNRYYDNESLEKILSDSNTLDTYPLLNESGLDKSLILPRTLTCDYVHKDRAILQDLFPEQEIKNEYSTMASPDLVQTELTTEYKSNEDDNGLVHSCDNTVTYKKEENLQYATSSSPEVSSTTPEEKGPAILLKIRSYKGSKISEVNDMGASLNHTHSHRPLITKAAQKYIPPLKETIHDLKVKIRLPKQSLYKLQQLKKSKEKPKIDTKCSKLYIKSLPQEIPKKTKPKPKFEDVLMSIDEIQFKKHKLKNKKNKQSVPKVIIKKNENGAHYASTQTKETFNPDLTGRKWQPWVFLEKSNFVDKMALKQKFKAIYSHRKKTFVLAENFRKYKSIANAKFVISHPKPNDNISTGKLKYTFRLKHS